jgi:hypothetical protein
MHPAQKQAILAMVQSIQGQLIALQGLVGMSASGAPPIQPSPSIPKDPQFDPLSEEEEDKIEASLEATRQDLSREAEIVAGQWERQRLAMAEMDMSL